MTHTTARRRLVVTTIVLLAIGGLAATASAHDFWIIPNPFQVAAGGTLEVLGQTSTRFPSTISAVAPERIADARVVGAAGATRITELLPRGKSLVLRNRPSAPGQYLVTATLAPTMVRSPGAAFRRWLELEGAPGEAARLDREGAFGGTDSVSRRTVKYAKAIAQVGAGGPRMFSRPAGQALEFVLDADPATVQVGDTLSVRLVYDGRDVTTAEAHAGAADWPIAEGAEVPEPHDVHLKANDQGILRLPITRAGVWNVRGMHVVPAAVGGGRAWDVHWATLVFQVGTGSPAGASAPNAGDRAAPGDSAEVVRTVGRLSQLIAAGDSLGVMALLMDDVVILESGDLESRAEYRSHHLAADIEFARAVKTGRTVQRVTVRGDAAWVSSTSTSQGTFRGRPINSAGAELVTLLRTPAGWRIAAIHWSSHNRRG
jgi:uncharacterized GH25 family protein/ketosteroid isomerase-like protein